MASTFSIDPTAIYDDGAISLALKVPLATLARARRNGQLRYSRKGRRVLYLGAWILAWVQADDSRLPRKQTEESSCRA
jgi:hypothetical protein